MRVIAFEEHFATPQFLLETGHAQIESQTTRLTDVGDGRIAEMDAAGVDVAVLSLTVPGLEQFAAADALPIAHDMNDFLADAIRRHPERLRGFAVLPTADPLAAARELDERVTGGQGFVGAVINGHCQGRRLDDEFFWPILECAEARRVPIYLHPTPPPQPASDLLYAGNYSPQVAEAFATNAWGWHIETALHVIRLILSGAFDRFPDLQIMVGHMSESLSFMMPRLDVTLPTALTELEQLPSHYLRRNVFYTFSGFNWLPQFLQLLLQVGVDRMMFSTDYPYRSMSEATAFLGGLPLSPEDREAIAHGNAEKLLAI